MSVSRLPSGRYRAQVYDGGKVVSAAKVLGLDNPTFASAREAKDAVTDARRKLAAEKGHTDITVKAWWDVWTTNPLYLRKRKDGKPIKTSSLLHLKHRTRGFVKDHRNMRLVDVDSRVVARWLESGNHIWTIPGLRKMFNAAKQAGHVSTNPFASLGYGNVEGNKRVDPPTEEQAAKMREKAWAGVVPIGFAAWFQVAQFSGCRGGELDALKWRDVDFDEGLIHVRRSFSRVSGEFTAPKNGQERDVEMLPQAREALLLLPEPESQDGFVFTNLRGDHWHTTSRQKHWVRLREAAGWDRTLYLATRHFAGFYLYELCGIDAEDVALMFGHTDGGALIRQLYGHRSKERARARIRSAVAAHTGDFTRSYTRAA